jgi:hypothetical protein
MWNAFLCVPRHKILVHQRNKFYQLQLDSSKKYQAAAAAAA